MSIKPAQRDKSNFSRKGPRVRAPNEALPNTQSFLDRGDYQPDPPKPVRAGADDHQRFRSRGFQT